MKARPTAEELAAIAVVLRSSIRAEPLANAGTTSLWARTARREGVRANVPQTWRG